MAFSAISKRFIWAAGLKGTVRELRPEMWRPKSIQ